MLQNRRRRGLVIDADGLEALSPRVMPSGLTPPLIYAPDSMDASYNPNYIAPASTPPPLQTTAPGDYPPGTSVAPIC
jgi:hypothetical protein